MKMTVADYITEKLSEASGKKIFLITGGMIMHLTDSLARKRDIECTCMHHEQALVMAAEAYGRYSGKLGVAYVTAGPAALNTLTGVVGAYVDRSPCVIVSGQSKVSQAKVTLPRQFALQGFNTLPLFDQVTKYAVMLDDISKVKYEVEKSIALAMTPPVGPVWIECPIDIQASTFDPDDYSGYIHESETLNNGKYNEILELLKTSKKATILAGAGIRQAGAVEEFSELINLLNIPVTTSRMGMDIIDNENACFVGRPGTYGDRAGNFTVQNSDLLIVLGNRLGVGLIGHDYDNFAPNAKKIIVDIDTKELEKPSVRPELAINMELKKFIQGFVEVIKADNFNTGQNEWLKKTLRWKNKYPVDLPEYVEEKDGINSYHFMRKFSENVQSNAIFAVDTGSCFHVHAQAFKVKFGQRHIITGGLSTMGYTPSVVGLAVAEKGTDKDIYCITGDGSIQMNIQEFQTIVHNNFPVKFIVLNNNGYLLIRHTQNNFMEGRLIGESVGSGVGFPNLEKLSFAYGIDYMKIENLAEMNDKISQLVNHKGSIVCEVFTPENQLLIPRVASKKLDDGKMVSMPYDDMYPFLPREEYLNEISD